MKHKEYGAKKIDKGFTTALEESLLSEQFFEFENVGNQMEDDVKFGDCFQGHFEFEEELLEASEAGMNGVPADTGGT